MNKIESELRKPKKTISIDGFLVNGYWKDGKEKFEGYFISKENFPWHLSEAIDNEIFFYGMDIEAIKANKKGIDGNDFKITKHEPHTLYFKMPEEEYNKICDAIKEQECRDFLAEKGYFVENLFSINDVMPLYHATPAQAIDILRNCFNNEATYDQIWLSLEVAADGFGIKKKNFIEQTINVDSLYHCGLKNYIKNREIEEDSFFVPMGKLDEGCYAIDLFSGEKLSLETFLYSSSHEYASDCVILCKLENNYQKKV